MKFDQIFRPEMLGCRVYLLPLQFTAVNLADFGREVIGIHFPEGEFNSVVKNNSESTEPGEKKRIKFVLSLNGLSKQKTYDVFSLAFITPKGDVYRAYAGTLKTLSFSSQPFGCIEETVPAEKADRRIVTLFSFFKDHFSVNGYKIISGS